MSDQVTKWDCGADGGNVTATLDGGTLTISGTGAMGYWEESGFVPWMKDKRGKEITSVIIEDGVTTIGDWAFAEYCGNLASATIPSSVTEIKSCAFCGTALKSITIPESVTVIEESAFAGCDRLTSITVLSATPPKVSSRDAFENTPFDDKNDDARLYVPKSGIDAYRSAKVWERFENVEGI